MIAALFALTYFAHPVVREHLTRKEIEDCVNYRGYLGETETLVNRVLSSYQKRNKRSGAKTRRRKGSHA